MQETKNISTSEPLTLNLKYNFSYIIVKKILFKSKQGRSYSFNDIMEFSPVLLVKSKTKNGVSIDNRYDLPSFFDIYSVNPIIVFKNDSMVIPEFNFERDFISSEFANESRITLDTNNTDLEIIMVFDKTPGVEVR